MRSACRLRAAGYALISFFQFLPVSGDRVGEAVPRRVSLRSLPARADVPSNEVRICTGMVGAAWQAFVLWFVLCDLYEAKRPFGLHLFPLVPGVHFAHRLVNWRCLAVRYRAAGRGLRLAPSLSGSGLVSPGGVFRASASHLALSHSLLQLVPDVFLPQVLGVSLWAGLLQVRACALIPWRGRLRRLAHLPSLRSA